MELSTEAKELVKRFLKTEKQKNYQFDFLVDSQKYIKWEDVEIGMEEVSKKEFVVTKEDVDAYNEATDEANPLFTCEEFAKKTAWGGLIAPPMFITPIAFWLAGDSEIGNWIKTPGAINPGQKIEFYEPIRVGDVIKARMVAHDKYIKRGKRYLIYYIEFFNQRGELVVKWWGTLILPLSKPDEEHKIEGVRK